MQETKEPSPKEPAALATENQLKTLIRDLKENEILEVDLHAATKHAEA